MRFSHVLSISIFLALPALASADPIVYDGFNYPVGSSLSGQNGGFGWNSVWGGSGLAANIAAGLSFQNLATSPGAVTSAPPSPPPPPDPEVAFYGRELTQSYGADGTSVYMSVLLRPDDGFGFYGGINLGGIFIGKSGPVNLYSIEGSTITSSTVAPVAGETVFLVLHAEFLPGNDRFSLFINPTPGGPEPAVANAIKTDFDLQSASFIFVNNAGSWTTDEIRLGATFESVSPAAAVPLPGTISLLLTMLPALVLFVRRCRGAAIRGLSR